MLSVIVLSVVMLYVIMLSVVEAGKLTISLIDGTSSFAGGTIITGVNVIKLFSSSWQKVCVSLVSPV
jgi:hypothetical protein